MAEKIPLNFYRRVTKKLKRSPESIYTAPSDRASTIISSIGSNTTNENRSISLSISSADSNETFLTIPNIPLDPLEYNNLLPSKLVIGEGDVIVASADIDDLATINDPGLFWLFDIPTGITNIDMQLGITSPAQVITNWGSTDYRIRITNENFDLWSAPSVSGSLANNTAFFGPTVGALNWVQGIYIEPTNNPSGNVTVRRMDSTVVEKQYFDTTYYARTELSGVNFGSTLLWQFTGGGDGFIGVQNDYIKPLEPYLGKQVNVTFWARASQPTKIFSETQVHSDEVVPNTGLWTPVQWKIFDIGTTWQQYQHVYILPTYEQVVRAGYNPGAVDVNNPQYIPLSASNSLPPLSSWQTQVDIKTLWTLGSHIRHGNHPNRPPFPGTAMSVAELSSIINVAVTNGYYDIAAVTFSIGDGSGNFTTQLSSGLQTAEFTYDPTIETDTNITLSILESINTP
jgi:hypothetical protein